MTNANSARVAIVVGGASGIGAGIVERFRADGWTVVVADRADGEGVERLDVADEASVQTVFDAVLAEHGRLDAVVNCAGISTWSPIVDHDVADFRSVVDVCLTGAFIVVKQAAKRMGAGGSIVSLTSLNARQPGPGLAAYCAAKSGLSMLTEVAALELGAADIRVNAVAPGLVITPLTEPAMDVPGVRDDYLENTPLGREGTAADIAGAVAFLCSTDATWMTGEVLDLNGGAHLRRYPDLGTHINAMLAGS